MIHSITKYSSLSFLVLLSFVLTSCLDGSTNPNQSRSNLLESAKEVTEGPDGDKVLTRYVDLLEKTDFDSTVANQGPFTAIIPTDSAFSALPENKLASLSGSELVDVVKYHLIDGVLNLNGLQSEEKIESLQGEDLHFQITSDVTGNRALVNGGQLLGQINASNGIIYIVDKVLFEDKNLNVPSLIEKRPQLNTLDSAIKDADLTETLDDENKGFTVFAPSNEAIDETKLTADDVQYHIIPEKLLSRDLDSQTYTTINGKKLTVTVDGSAITVNGNATITEDDIEGTNGVVHIINSTLQPSSE